MTLKEYLEKSARTESPLYRVDNIRPETVHAALGLCTESGELLGAIKKALFYGRKLDRKHVKEELGDILWFVSQLLRSEGWTWEEVMIENIEKLEKRYPERFSEELAYERRDKATDCK